MKKIPFTGKFVIWLLCLVAFLAVLLTLAVLGSKIKTNYKTLLGIVVTNNDQCADIGMKIFEKGGSTADVAISVLVCEGALSPHLMGLGGGFLATIYIKSKGRIETLIAKEVAPLAADNKNKINKVAVPGELKGYSALHKKYGKLNWTDLIEPTVNLCESGFSVSKLLHKSLENSKDEILRIPSLKEIFVNENTQEVWKENDVIFRKKLAETLKEISIRGEDAIYDSKSKYAKLLIEDLDGVLTGKDLDKYEVLWEETLTVNLPDEMTLHLNLDPSSGPVLGLMVNVAMKTLTEDIPLYWHRIIEGFKHALGLRTLLGDGRFNANMLDTIHNMVSLKFAEQIKNRIYDDKIMADPFYYGSNFSNVEDFAGTTVIVLGENGDAIVVTSSLNDVFGAKLRSPQTGIILNSQMKSFSKLHNSEGDEYPESPLNYIEPGKIPLSSMCPSIVLDKEKNVRLLIGGGGMGLNSITAVAEVIIRHMLLKEPLKDSVSSKRIHPELHPMEIEFEKDFNATILSFLEKIGHKRSTVNMVSSTAVTSLGVNNENQIRPLFDQRIGGSFKVFTKKVEDDGD